MYKNLLFVFLLVTITLLSILFCINSKFDPYGYNAPLTNPKLEKIHKPLKLLELRPEIIVIGNSRNLYTFDAFNSKIDNFYNASLPGLGISRIAELFYHAASTPNSIIKEAYLSLDQICDQNDSDITFEVDKRFLIGPENSIYNVLFNKYALYTSLDTLLLSINMPKKPVLNQRGRQIVFNEGNYQTRGSANALITREKSNIKGQNVSQSSYADFVAKCDTTSIDNILAVASKMNIEITFFINPVNVRYWEIARQTGSLNTYLFNKKLAKDKLKSPFNKHKAVVRLFDFRKLNEYTLERLSYHDKHSSHRYWYESSHFKKEFGKIIMSNMDSDSITPTKLGGNLLDIDIDADFQIQLKILDEWELINPDLVAEIERAISNTK